MEVITVIKAEHVSDKILALTFSDGVRGEVDFSSWIERYPYFAPLKDDSFFQKFSLDGWTVSWPNGADIAPETLHKIAVATASAQTV